MLFVNRRRGSDKQRSVSIASGISSSAALESVAMSNVDSYSSGVNGLLRLNSGYSAIGDSGNILMRTGISSSGVGRSGVIGVGFGDSP